MTIETAEGATFDAIVFGERESKRWMAGSEFFRRTKDVGGLLESAAPSKADPHRHFLSRRRHDRHLSRRPSLWKFLSQYGPIGL